MYLLKLHYNNAVKCFKPIANAFLYAQPADVLVYN